MAQIILHHNGAYNIFTTETDRPRFESALTFEQLQFVIRNEQGTEGFHALIGPVRLSPGRTVRRTSR